MKCFPLDKMQMSFLFNQLNHAIKRKLLNVSTPCQQKAVKTIREAMSIRHRYKKLPIALKHSSYFSEGRKELYEVLEAMMANHQIKSVWSKRKIGLFAQTRRARRDGKTWWKSESTAIMEQEHGS